MLATVRDLSADVEARLARDLGAIHRRLAAAWAELTEAAEGAPGPADVERLVDLARRLLTAYAALHAPVVVAAQRAAVASSVAASRPEGVTAWRAPAGDALAGLTGTVRGGEAVAAWLAGKAGVAVDAIRGLVEGGASVDGVAAFAQALGGLGGAVLMGSRTAVHDAGRSATLATYRAQPEGTVTGWRWVCSLTDRSCLACVALHGRIFPLDEEFQASHPGCECGSEPVRTGEGDINATGDDWLAGKVARGELENVPPTARNDLLRGKLELRDFLHKEPDRGFGASYRQSTVTEARARATAEKRLPGRDDLPIPAPGSARGKP